MEKGHVPLIVHLKIAFNWCRCKWHRIPRPRSAFNFNFGLISSVQLSWKLAVNTVQSASKCGGDNDIFIVVFVQQKVDRLLHHFCRMRGSFSKSTDISARQICVNYLHPRYTVAWQTKLELLVEISFHFDANRIRKKIILMKTAINCTRLFSVTESKTSHFASQLYAHELCHIRYTCVYTYALTGKF